MTPTERAALLLKVQRALDKAGVNRDNFGLTICTVHLDDGYYVALCVMAMEAEVIQNDPFERDYADMTTFTFTELFPELEWEDGTLRGYGDSIQSAAIPGYALRIYGGGLLELQNSFDSSQELSLLFRTPERAKRAAQSIADLLAEAGRES